MDRETLSDDSVVTEMKGILCYSVDTDSETGRPLSLKYNATRLPALLFLEPDGQERDRIRGFLPAKPFLDEVKRIKSGENTLSGLRKAVEKAPDDVDAIYALAVKLKTNEDVSGYQRLMKRIRELDPEGKSLAMRTVKFEELLRELNQDLSKLQPLRDFLEKESAQDILFRGWYAVWMVEGMNVEKTREKNPTASAAHRRKWVDAARAFWKNLPERLIPSQGNKIAWAFYEARDELNAEDLAFALELARKASAAEPEDVSLRDTLACCLYATGKREEAIREVERCIELDPKNVKWRQRLKTFSEKRNAFLR